MPRKLIPETQGISSLTKYLSRLPESKNRSSRALANDPRIIDALEHSKSLAEVEHPKQARLRELVTEQLDANPDSKLIVFTQFRDTVERIVENLNRASRVSAVRFVGQATVLDSRQQGRACQSQSSAQNLQRKGRSGAGRPWALVPRWGFVFSSHQERKHHVGRV